MPASAMETISLYASATLIPVTNLKAGNEFDAVAFIYIPPKAGKFDGLAADVSLVWDGSKFTIEAEYP